MTISENSINTLGTDLALQPLRQAPLSIMGGLVTVNTDGNLSVSGNAAFAKDVKVYGKLAAGIIAPVPNEDLVFKIGNPIQDSIPTEDETRQGRQDSKFAIRNSDDQEVVSIDKSGNITASGSALFSNFKLVRGAQADASFTETIASGSAGTTSITANETERTIITPYVNKNSLIYITPVSDTFDTMPYIARQTVEDQINQIKGSFTIQIPHSQDKDIKLNWIIVN